MQRSGMDEWQPLLRASAIALLVLVVGLASGVQASDRLLQTVPTPTPEGIPPPDVRRTPRPPGEPPPPPAADGLQVRSQASPQDVLPGKDLEIRLWITNTAASAVPGIVLSNPLHPTLDLIAVDATQGVAEIQDRELVLYIGTLEAGQAAAVVIRTRVGAGAQPGEIILNQAAAYHQGTEVLSNIAAAGLPPVDLPATGYERRRP